MTDDTITTWWGRPLTDLSREELIVALSSMAGQYRTLHAEWSALAGIRAQAFLSPRRRGWRWPYGDLP